MKHIEPVVKPDMRIGLFGGSFNPAHTGHLHVSKMALERLQLDKVWWLLSPQNPLKDASDYAPYEERAQSARSVIDDSRVELSFFEEKYKLSYSVDTIHKLMKIYSTIKFVWLMGADAFADIDLWKEWQVIVETIPIAVFNRPESGDRALNSKAAHKYRANRIDEKDATQLIDKKAPVWCFINQPLDYSASRKIRAQK